MIYGFIGTGTITEAMVSGMSDSPLPVTEIVVSPRNADIASRLAARHPKVKVAPSNQAVADAAEILILAVRPQIVEDVLKEIHIPPSRKIISVVAATSHEALARWTGHDAAKLVRAIPLPFVSQRDGVTAIFPANRDAEDLFNALGTAVACDDKRAFDLLAAASAMMGTYFGLMELVTEWLERNGMESSKAQNYLTRLYRSLANVAIQSPDASFRQLREEYSTRGGLNEQIYRDFLQAGGADALNSALDGVLKRIENR